MSGRRKIVRVPKRGMAVGERDYDDDDDYDYDDAAVKGLDCDLDSGEEADLMQDWFTHGVTQCGGLEPTAISLKETTLDDVKQALSLRTDRLEQNVTLMFKRAFTEILALRKESAIFKTKVQEVLAEKPTTPSMSKPPYARPSARTVAAPGGVSSAPQQHDTLCESYDEDEQYEMEIEYLTSDSADTTRRELPKKEKTSALPKAKKTAAKQSVATAKPTAASSSGGKSTEQRTKMNIITGVPFNTLDEFLKFEEDIANESELEDRFIDILTALYCRKKEAYAHSCWRFILTDQVAMQLCWNGTATKMSIREMRITNAIQTAFQQRYDDDEMFVLNSQRFFRYANVRLQATIKNQQKAAAKAAKKADKKRK